MKNHTKQELESARPNHSPAHCIQFALDALYRDQTKCLEDDVVDGLSFEELIGALLLAKDNAPQSICLANINTNN